MSKPLSTHCMRGHEFTPSNTYVYTRKSGLVVRQCRTCQATRENARRAKRLRTARRYYPM